MADAPFMAAPLAATSSTTIAASATAATAAVLSGDGDADPTTFGHRPVEVPRELVGVVARSPVVVVEVGAGTPDALSDGLVVAIGAKSISWRRTPARHR
ncbi:MAG: hypothetical protein R2701_11800 [Acidimicrobiales bacterium]